MCGFHCIVFMEYMHAGKTCRKTVGIKRYKPIYYKEKEEKAWSNSVVRKRQLNTFEVQISNSFIHSYISHDKSVNNVLRGYEMKEEIKKSWNFCGIYYIKTV